MPSPRQHGFGVLAVGDCKTMLEERKRRIRENEATFRHVVLLLDRERPADELSAYRISAAQRFLSSVVARQGGLA
jgi:hypothetical protein